MDLDIFEFRLIVVIFASRSYPIIVIYLSFIYHAITIRSNLCFRAYLLPNVYYVNKTGYFFV